jgi:hypothetical protein
MRLNIKQAIMPMRFFICFEPLLAMPIFSLMGVNNNFTEQLWGS